MRWAGHVACMGRGNVNTGFWWGNIRERGLLEDPSVDGRIILIWIIRNWDGEAWTGLIWLRIRDRWLALVNAVMNPRVL